ncbi:MAG TPA: Tex family protein [Polyangiaceae bacterium]|nr:Tex family protein [Polyangiaceae bacterium]
MTAPSETAPPAAPAFDPIPLLAEELSLPAQAVASVVRLIAEGGTVPFIARYRKEATGGLDEVQIRAIGERFEYVTELEARRGNVIEEIQKQGKLTPELLQRLRAVSTKAELEDLYLPYKPKRRTRAVIALERGLGPLAELMWAQDVGAVPEVAAAAFVNAEKEVPDVRAALSGARDVCAERLSEDAELRKTLREAYLAQGSIAVKKRSEHEDKVTKFDMYANFEEPIAKVPSHRFLAIRRGENEGVLYATLSLDLEPHLPFAYSRIPVKKGSPWQAELEQVVADSLERLLSPAVSGDVRVELKLRSDKEAIEVFAQNLRELLLSAPLGEKAVLGIDPGQRTGCKCAVVDATGKLLEHDTIYLVQGDGALERARQTLRGLCKKHGILAVAVGNGTHGRETEAFVREFLEKEGLAKTTFLVSVNEAGASIYSASDVAREEFPDLDLTVRGAVSIARRLQDPLAELVKIDPKSIGVGQYQHDVSQPALGRKLDEVVESCVNSVGVELNTASAPLLSRVAGIGGSLAKRIVSHRDQHGPFRSRKALLDVSGLGPRTFEQAAGFLRIAGAEHPLDRSAVHPERYGLVERMAADLKVPLPSLIGNAALLGRIDLGAYKGGDVGDFTLKDILAELDKPGRDPRSSFEPPKFRDDVRELADLKPGMELEGVVTNITAFGAFVDVGVHQDGLVHISELADRFVKDPHDVVKVGQKVAVRVLEIDLGRKRIALSARSGQPKPSGERPQPERGAANQRDAGGPRRDGGGNARRDGGAHPKQGSAGARSNAGNAGNAPKPAGDGKALSHNPFAAFFNKS